MVITIKTLLFYRFFLGYNLRNELVRKGYRVYICKLKDNEIDFIAERKTEKIYMSNC